MHRATTTPHAIAASDNRGIKTTGHTFEAFEAQMAVPWPVTIGELAAPRGNFTLGAGAVEMPEPEWSDALLAEEGVLSDILAQGDNSEPDWGDNAKTWLPSTLLTLWCLGLLDSNYFGL